MGTFDKKHDKHAPLPEAVRDTLARTAEQLQSEKARVAETLATAQGGTTRRYYEGMERGIETALVILAGEAETERQRHVRGDRP